MTALPRSRFARWQPQIGLVVSSMAFFHGASAFAAPLGQAPEDDISWLRVGVALLLCLMLAVAGAFILKARSGGGVPFSGRNPLLEILAAKKPGRLQLIETLRLGHQTDLSIVRCDGRELLVLTSPQRAELLDRLPGESPGDSKER